VSLDVVVAHRDEGGRGWPVLWWDAGPGWRMAASSVVGGGIGERRWWLNTTVDREYHHPDPARHVREIAAGTPLRGEGVGMLTAVDVTAFCRAEDGGALVVATVGLGLPVWAAAAQRDAAGTPPAPGTINLLVVVPHPLSDAALVNAVVTATEAKTQALLRAGVDGSGTSSDAICVACPASGEPDPYGGPRSTWGSRLARAVHAAVAEGTADWLAGEGHGP